jgi:hypothetical protein
LSTPKSKPPEAILARIAGAMMRGAFALPRPVQRLLAGRPVEADGQRLAPAVVVHRRATRRRCQSRIVLGVTSMPSRRAGGSRSASAAMTARSGHVNRGRPTWRCNTAS